MRVYSRVLVLGLFTQNLRSEFLPRVLREQHVRHTMALVDIAVTYGDTLGPPRFHKLTRRVVDDVAELSAPDGRGASLWVQHAAAAPELAPVSDVVLIGDGCAAPADFVKVGKDLRPDAADSSLFIFVRRCGNADAPADSAAAPIADLLLSEPTPAAGEVYEAVTLVRAEGDCDAGAEAQPPFQLWLRRQRPDEVDAASKARAAAALAQASASNSAAELSVGAWFDCLDSARTWREAEVIEPVTASHITVSYLGWESRFDHALARSSRRIAPHRAHTAGKDTRSPTYARENWGAPWAIDVAAVDALAAQLVDFERGRLDESSLFWMRTLPDFIEDALLRSIESSDVARSVGQLMQRLAHLCTERYVCDVSRRVPPLVLRHLRQLLGSNARAHLYAHVIGEPTDVWWGGAAHGSDDGSDGEKARGGGAASAAASLAAASPATLPTLRFASAAPRKRRDGYFSSAVPTSYHWVGCVENFGRAGGFEAILRRLIGEEQRIRGGRGDSAAASAPASAPAEGGAEGGDAPPPVASTDLAELAALLCAIAPRHGALDRDFAAPYAERLYAAVHARLTRCAVADDERAGGGAAACEGEGTPRDAGDAGDAGAAGDSRGSTDLDIKGMYVAGKFAAEALFGALAQVMRDARVDRRVVDRRVEVLRLGTAARLLDCSLLNYRISGEFHLFVFVLVTVESLLCFFLTIARVPPPCQGLSL